MSIPSEIDVVEEFAHQLPDEFQMYGSMVGVNGLFAIRAYPAEYGLAGDLAVLNFGFYDELEGEAKQIFLRFDRSTANQITQELPDAEFPEEWLPHLTQARSSATRKLPIDVMTTRKLTLNLDRTIVDPKGNQQLFEDLY